MDSVNKTLYIPLYGKSYVSKRGILLHDPKAEEIWEREGFLLHGKAGSKWLAYYMGMRSAVFDGWIREQLARTAFDAVIHLGCGLDSRVERIGSAHPVWYDVDFPEVIRERRRYYTETASARMIEGDIRTDDWLRAIPKDGNALIVMEGVSMYLTLEELGGLFRNLSRPFSRFSLLMDCYTVLAAKASKWKNPINEVGVTQVYGLDDPKVLEQLPSLSFVAEHDMTPKPLIRQLSGMEASVFQSLYAGSLSKKLYRLYEYQYIQP